jgi:hypothetical protein
MDSPGVAQNGFLCLPQEEKSVFPLSRIEQEQIYVHFTDPSWLQARILSKL